MKIQREMQVGLPSLLIVLGAVLLGGCMTDGHAFGRNRYGIVRGKTLSIVSGIPGALAGKPDPNWTPPEPSPAPNETLFWLRIDRENGHQLFSTQSNSKGNYKIKLPAGRYLMACASHHQWELDRLDNGKKDDPNTLIGLLFTVLRRDDKGRAIFDGEPGTEIKARGTQTIDIPAQIMFVD